VPAEARPRLRPGQTRPRRDLVAEAERAFGTPAEGGTVQMSMQPTFWARTRGLPVDRFGTPWIVNGELLPLA